MKFYAEKFSEIIEKRSVNLSKLAKDAELARSSLWLWKTGKIVPSEKRVRKIARALNISVNQISDLKPEIPVSDALS